MSLFEVLAVFAGWCCIAFVVASFWHMVRRKQPRTRPAAGPPKCTCGICTGRVQTIGVMLTAQQIESLQTAVLAVGVGATPALGLGFDHVNANGVGRVCVVVVNGPLFEQVVGPAITQHLNATRLGT